MMLYVAKAEFQKFKKLKTGFSVQDVLERLYSISKLECLADQLEACSRSFLGPEHKEVIEKYKIDHPEALQRKPNSHFTPAAAPSKSYLIVAMETAEAEKKKTEKLMTAVQSRKTVFEVEFMNNAGPGGDKAKQTAFMTQIKKTDVELAKLAELADGLQTKIDTADFTAGEQKVATDKAQLIYNAEQKGFADEVKNELDFGPLALNILKQGGRSSTQTIQTALHTAGSHMAPTDSESEFDFIERVKQVEKQTRWFLSLYPNTAETLGNFVDILLQLIVEHSGQDTANAIESIDENPITTRFERVLLRLDKRRNFLLHNEARLKLKGLKRRSETKVSAISLSHSKDGRLDTERITQKSSKKSQQFWKKHSGSDSEDSDNASSTDDQNSQEPKPKKVRSSVTDILMGLGRSGEPSTLYNGNNNFNGFDPLPVLVCVVS